uniref:RING-type domain-containing protein n=1 Tax=viral metagenome TaxID=1070528 RepID=A0A6C0LGE0_9ZZZZ
MEYNNNQTNESTSQITNENNSTQNNSTQNIILRPLGYFYTTTFSITPTFIESLFSFDSPLSIPPYEQNDNFDSGIHHNSQTSNPNIINSSNLRLYDLSNTFFPTVNLIEIIFNDYIKNKNKLNDEEYEKNVEKIYEKFDECPVCFTSSETTIKIKKCNHAFCEDCIQTWLKSHKNTCPICRVNVIMETENDNTENDNTENNNTENDNTENDNTENDNTENNC